jgi:peroxiredoxin
MRNKIITILSALSIFAGISPAAEVAAGSQAPEFALANYDGKTVSLADYKGKVVVLEGFNYECPFVKYHYAESKTLIELPEKYKDKGVVWLAINSMGHQTTEANKEFAEKFKLGYPILDDRTGKVGHLYGAKTTPHMFIIDTKGDIAYNGAIDNSPMGREPNAINYVNKALAELAEGKEVSIANTAPYGCSVKYAD